jgi:hypothetical protein
MRLTFAFWSAKAIWIPKKPNDMFHKAARLRRGFSIVIPSATASAERRGDFAYPDAVAVEA